MEVYADGARLFEGKLAYPSGMSPDAGSSFTVAKQRPSMVPAAVSADETVWEVPPGLVGQLGPSALFSTAYSPEQVAFLRGWQPQVAGVSRRAGEAPRRAVEAVDPHDVGAQVADQAPAVGEGVEPRLVRVGAVLPVGQRRVVLEQTVGHHL